MHVFLENMIYKGLNEDDASFLSEVAKKQAEIDDNRFNEESKELLEYKISFQLIRIIQ